MDLNGTRIILAGFWLLVGVALLLRDTVGLTWLSDRYPAENLNLGGGVALAFAIWNAVRWYAGRRRSRVAARPLTPKPTEDRPFEYNPELDFHKPDAEVK